MEELRQQAEHYLGTEIEPSEWDKAKAYAERKLKGIIEREGDGDGERRKPYYLAQLIAETVRSDFPNSQSPLWSYQNSLTNKWG